VRISGGSLKGRKLASKRFFSTGGNDDELRPTSAKVREALFDILRNGIKNSVFLDLYAGTGAVGLEALSRGARQVILVEKSPVRTKAVKDYLKAISGEEQVKIHRQRVEYFLKRASAAGATFDIIFADPPYTPDAAEKVLTLLKDTNVVEDEGCVIIEHSSKSVYTENAGRLTFVKNYRYGDTMLSVYRKMP
jgi:16S rRNA (guanine(966)-N(2))-methyltransferase RsmD